MSPVVYCYSLVDISDVDDSPSSSVDRKANYSDSFVNPVEYNRETFHKEEISDQAHPVRVPCENFEALVDSLFPVKVESCRTHIKFLSNRNAFMPFLEGDGTSSNSNDSLYRARPCKHSILPVYSEHDSSSNVSYNRDSSDVSIADADIIKRRKRRKRRHKKLRFSRRESVYQPNCDISWRVNKPIREPCKPTLSYPYPSTSSLPQYSKVSSFNDAHGLINFEQVKRSIIHSSPEQEVYRNFSSCNP